MGRTFHRTGEFKSPYQNEEVNDNPVSLRSTCGRHDDPPAGNSFLERRPKYSYKSVTVQNIQDARRVPISYISRKILPRLRSN